MYVTSLYTLDPYKALMEYHERKGEMAMQEIKLKKRLPNLTPEEEQIFTEAIAEAYQRGRADATQKLKWKKYRDVIYCPECLNGFSATADFFEDVTRDMAHLIAEHAELNYCPVCGVILGGIDNG